MSGACPRPWACTVTAVSAGSAANALADLTNPRLVSRARVLLLVAMVMSDAGE